MLFFKRILKEPAPAADTVPQVERRSAKRFAVDPQFPLKAVLSFIGRDDTGAPMSHSRHGWNWKGRLLDCSEQGARIQMGPVLKAKAGDPCDLILSLEDFELSIPCHVANIREQAAGLIFGLKYDLENEMTRNAYDQLLEILALGSALRFQRKTTKPDESGYLLEQYTSDRPSCLTIWRQPADGSVAAFAFQLKDSLVRAVAGAGTECLTGADAQPATAAKALEIRRLFAWVVLNLAPAVPEDARDFLRLYAG